MTAGQVCLLLVANDEVKEWDSRSTRGLGPGLKRNRKPGYIEQCKQRGAWGHGPGTPRVSLSYTRRYGRVAVWVIISLDISVNACGLVGAAVLHYSGDLSRDSEQRVALLLTS
ncbi:hypothetical protein AUEXF2481DRAFT_366853 [Aureobasidium subglaciale EXF-2481]|uniref:Uncharacterized protein n=1 Tax=Aureobasidium subglaciale (strain EXF-2481) TaxID=1043005 RepID=A0A074Y5D9_AURSE|nr:uncharacterized protein AUEXF2481DRAFT_366853 [Aureobasidium subglaciale EXF-2481]KEQ92945.1 hypothetical protein AUEXF2481DRAFT_366853 [Aureobasidium subglaciale EXF-2481]